MKKISPRVVGMLIAIGFSSGGLLPLAQSASPADDITQAVVSAGAPNVKQASPEVFTNALQSVLVGVAPDATAPYIEAATKLRPDLGPRITEAAADVESATIDNDADSLDRHRRSPNRHRVRICCRGHTLVLSPKEAIYHLLHHPRECHIGACPSHIHDPLQRGIQSE